MKNIKYTKISVCVISIMMFLVSFNSNGQEDLTRYYLKGLPQSSYTNMSHIPEGKFYIGFPGLSSTYFGLQLPIKPGDILSVRSDDSLSLDVDRWLDNMKKGSFTSFQLQHEILAFGFKIKDNQYFNFSLSENMVFNMYYPKDLLVFGWRGNRSEELLGEVMETDRLGVNFTHYHEMAFGYSRIINEKLTVGGRLKYIRGTVNLRTKRNSFGIGVSENMDTLTLSTDVLIKTTIPLNYNTSDTSFSFNDNAYSGDSLVAMMTGKGNTGFGIDLGATYNLNEKITLSASVTDLGFIRWNSTPRIFTSKNEFKTEGVSFPITSDMNMDSVLSELGDTLFQGFNIQQQNTTYTTVLNSRIYLGGTYNLTEKDRFGALARIHVYNKSVHPSVTLSYNRRFGGAFSLSTTYSMYNREYANVGFGFNVNLFPWQIYLVTDNILAMTTLHPVTSSEGASADFYMPHYKNFSFHFGMNFVFGYKDKKNKKGDKIKEKKEKKEKEDMDKLKEEKEEKKKREKEEF